MHTTRSAKPQAEDRPEVTPPVASARHSSMPAGSVFLLSPASLSGVRGRRLLEGGGNAVLAERLRGGEPVSLGEVYASISSLYFRGKLAYARRFACEISSGGVSLGVHVITPDRGLRAADAPIGLDDLRRMAATAIDERESAYMSPLKASAKELVSRLPAGRSVVLLGSLATRKYLTPLLEVFADRLHVPRAFIGLGDMSRGGLMLESVRQGRELEYVAASVAWERLRGPRR
jgi:hypothetical protein